MGQDDPHRQDPNRPRLCGYWAQAQETGFDHLISQSDCHSLHVKLTQVPSGEALPTEIFTIHSTAKLAFIPCLWRLSVCTWANRWSGTPLITQGKDCRRPLDIIATSSGALSHLPDRAAVRAFTTSNRLLASHRRAVVICVGCIEAPPIGRFARDRAQSPGPDDEMRWSR